MEPPEQSGKNSEYDPFLLAAEQYRDGKTPSEIEAMLVEQGISPMMASNVVHHLLNPTRATRGFGNLNLDLWQVIRINPFLFVFFPVIVWFPFTLLAEHAALAVEGGFLAKFRTYNHAMFVPEILVGAWLAAVVFYGVRQLARGSSATFFEAITGGTREYGRFLKTTWSFSWRVGMASLLFVIPGIVLMLRYILAIPVTAFEGLSGKEAVHASSALMKGKYWRLIRYYLGFFLVYIPWAYTFEALMPPGELPILSALAAIPYNIIVSMWTIWLALMYVDTAGNQEFAEPVGCRDSISSDGTPQRPVPRGRKRLAVTAILGCTLMILSVLRQPDPPIFDGTRITFGDNEQFQIYYDDDVTQMDAWLLGDALVQVGWFEDEAPTVVRLGIDKNSFWVYFHITEDLISNEEVMKYLRWMESYLSEIMDKPTNMVMLIPAWSGVKEIGVSREIRPLDSWEIDSAFREPDVTGEEARTNMLLEPVLESVAGNPEVARWIDEWEEVCGEFMPWSFVFVDVNVTVLNEYDGCEFGRLAGGEILKALRSTLEWAPSEKYAMNMFVHNLRYTETGWSLQRVEANRWIYLFRLSDTKGWPILVADASTFLQSIGWVGAQTAVVLGISPDGSDNCLYIWRFQIDGLTVRMDRHQGPAVTPSQYETLTKRWPAWVREHYPEVKWEAE